MIFEENEKRTFWFPAGRIVALVSLAATTLAASPTPDALRGLTAAEVVRSQGEPGGRLQGGGSEIWIYSEYRLRFRGGTVVEVDELVRPIDSAQPTVDLGRIDRERAASHRLRGEMLHASVSQDPAFAAGPAVERLAFWTAFQRRHPDLDVGSELTSAREDAVREARAAAARREADPPRRAMPAYTGGSGSRWQDLDRQIAYPILWASPPARRGWREPVVPVEPAPPPPADESLRARTLRENEEARRETYRRIQGH